MCQNANYINSIEPLKLLQDVYFAAQKTFELSYDSIISTFSYAEYYSCHSDQTPSIYYYSYDQDKICSIISSVRENFSKKIDKNARDLYNAMLSFVKEELSRLSSINQQIPVKYLLIIQYNILTYCARLVLENPKLFLPHRWLLNSMKAVIDKFIYAIKEIDFQNWESYKNEILNYLQEKRCELNQQFTNHHQ